MPPEYKNFPSILRTQAAAKANPSRCFDSMCFQDQEPDFKSALIVPLRSSVVFSRKESCVYSRETSVKGRDSLPSSIQGRPTSRSLPHQQEQEPLRNCLSAGDIATGSRRFSSLSQSKPAKYFHGKISPQFMQNKPPTANLSALMEKGMNSHLNMADSSAAHVIPYIDSETTLLGTFVSRCTPSWQVRIKEAFKSLASQQGKAQQNDLPHRIPGVNEASRQLSSPTVQNIGLEESSGSDPGVGPITRYVVKPFVRRLIPNPITVFKPKRSDAFHVFNAIDKHMNGKLTRSQLQSEAIRLGFALESVDKLFDRLDHGGKGYLTTADWGREGTYDSVELFSLQYMRKFMGLPELNATPEQVKRYYRVLELKRLKSVKAAIRFMRSNVTAISPSSGTGKSIYDAFRFIDVNDVGELTQEELQDAFAAMQVHMSDKVVSDLVKHFSKEGSKRVDYKELLVTLFPPPVGSSTL